MVWDLDKAFDLQARKAERFVGNTATIETKLSATVANDDGSFRFLRRGRVIVDKKCLLSNMA